MGDKGAVTTEVTIHNQRGELVYRAEVVGFSKLRDYRLPLRLKLLQALTKLPVIGKAIQRNT